MECHVIPEGHVRLEYCALPLLIYLKRHSNEEKLPPRNVGYFTPTISQIDRKNEDI